MASVRPAASVVLTRDDGRVLWVRRGEQLRFAGGFYAFPGGGVDVADAGVALRNAGDLDAAQQPCIVAAARELFEETGVLAVAGRERVSQGERKAMREALLARPKATASFADFLRKHDLAIDAAQFLPAGRWVTPLALPIRFDARFYLVKLPPGEVAEIWPGELADGEWIAPQDALKRWEDGTALLHPPAWHTLKALQLPDPLPVLRDPSKAPWKLPLREHIVERIEFQRGVVMVPLRSPTLPPATHTNCLLLGDENLYVVDPGSPYPEEQAILRETLDKLAEEGRRAKAVILTHHHYDHTAGAQVLGLPIWATAQTADRLDFKPDRLISDNELLEAGPRGWRMLHLPGHTRGHLCLVEEKSGAIVAGDLVAGVGTVVIDPPEGDMSDYLHSLDRLLSGEPGTLYPAHGPVVPAGQAKLVEYKQHRLAREQLVFQALTHELLSLSQLVPQAYPDVKPEIWPLAERSLLAHLYKLAKDGRAVQQDERFKLP